MKITINTSGYNERRYGKPWIARVDFAAKAGGEFLWGNWIGQPGEPGELSVEAEAGDIIARGQRDNRNPRNSAPDFYILQEGGTLRPCGSKIEAVRAAREYKESAR
jgi:hypothetical protein